MKGITCKTIAGPVYDWKKLIEQVETGACLSLREKISLQENLAARIITVTAYHSGCHDPERIIVTNLTTLVAAYRCKELANHKKGETLANRLLPLLYFPGGNPEVVKACSILLQLLSLNDHYHDFSADLVNGKYNPLLDTNYEEERHGLLGQFQDVDLGVQRLFQKYLREVTRAAFWAI